MHKWVRVFFGNALAVSLKMCFASLSPNSFLFCVTDCSVLSCVDAVFIGLVAQCVQNKLTSRAVVSARSRLIRFKQDTCAHLVQAMDPA